MPLTPGMLKKNFILNQPFYSINSRSISMPERSLDKSLLVVKIVCFVICDLLSVA